MELQEEFYQKQKLEKSLLEDRTNHYKDIEDACRRNDRSCFLRAEALVTSSEGKIHRYVTQLLSTCEKL